MSIDSIYIAMTGLDAFERGLRVISNNTANLNTPGFKSSVLQFADLFHSGGGAGGSVARDYGYGLTTLGTKLDFSQGQLRTTGNGLDLAVDGLGFFVLRDEAGRVRYTRDGQFTFGADGVLVSTTTGEQVLAFDGGTLGPVRISDLKANAAKPTGTITFTGNLSSTATSHTIGSVVVIDAAGASHSLTVKLEQAADSPGTWNVTLLDGAATVGTAQVAFLAGRPDPARSKASFTYGPAGQPEMALTLDLSTNVTSFDTGSRSTLALGSQDGHGAGELTGTSFDEKGELELAYSNGQKVKGPRLALARFDSPDDVRPSGENAYEASDGRAWETGVAGEQGFGSIRPGMIETSNVDLSEEFSTLVIMQRGYQASSQVISTANEMIGELFAMRGSK